MVGGSDAGVSFSSRYVSGSRYESSRYRPRRERGHGRGPWRGRGASQIHAGFLDPDGTACETTCRLRLSVIGARETSAQAGDYDVVVTHLQTSSRMLLVE